MYFKLLPKVGSHVEKDKDGNAVTYHSKDGRIIDTEMDLVKRFPNKFERVEVNPTAKSSPKDEAAPVVEEAAPVVVEDEVAQVVEEAAPVVVEDEVAQVEEKSKSKSKSKTHPLGRDVTKRFPKADKNDFKVFSQGGAFSVVEADEDTVPLNEKPLHKKGVDDFITEFLK